MMKVLENSSQFSKSFFRYLTCTFNYACLFIFPHFRKKAKFDTKIAQTRQRNAQNVHNLYYLICRNTGEIHTFRFIKSP